jgi:hypothetical protein
MGRNKYFDMKLFNVNICALDFQSTPLEWRPFDEAFLPWDSKIWSAEFFPAGIPRAIGGRREEGEEEEFTHKKRLLKRMLQEPGIIGCPPGIRTPIP